MATFSGVTPTWVLPQEPEYYTLVTQTESMKKHYANLSGTSSVERFKLMWTRMTDANFAYLKGFYHDRKGGYESFTWHTVPAYIDTDADGVADGSDMDGRWVEGTFRFRPQAKFWEAEVVFEKEVD